MPEGDTVWRTAAHLREALVANVLTGTDFRVPDYATADLSGHRVDDVVSHGKHILMHVGPYTIHTHLKMEGAWHVYVPDQRWRRPAFEARLILQTARVVAVGFALGIVEVVALGIDPAAHLGPDPLGPSWDLDEALRRLTGDPATPVFTALHDQRNIAGFGNEYVNEMCFVNGVQPQRSVSDVPDLRRMVTVGKQMITANRDRVQRTFTGERRKGQRHWVFSREGQPCRRCGTTIGLERIGPDPLSRRNAFWCPHCQR